MASRSRSPRICGGRILPGRFFVAKYKNNYDRMGLANMQFIQLSGEVRYSFSDSFVQKRTIFGRASELKKQRSPGSLGPDCKSMARSRSPRRYGGRILPVLRMQRHAYQESFTCENGNNYSEVARHKGMTIARSCHADFQSCQHLPTVSFGKFYRHCI